MSEAAPNLSGRSFLLLQGPQSPFFRVLAARLEAAGARVKKVNFCGGDVFLWGFRRAYWYRENLYRWPAWIGEKYRRDAVTDICLYGDWRPLHWEAVRLARRAGIRVWVFEEGYLRQGYSTLEPFGVNGRSRMTRVPEEIFREAEGARDCAPRNFNNRLSDKVWKAVLHHVGNVLLWPLFPHYRTHRPTSIFYELIGIIPRFLKRRSREERSRRRLERFEADDSPYFFFPLQLNADSQIRLYSPFASVQESIVDVLTSFASCAPEGTRLLIRNHPLDNGLIDYETFIGSFARELGISERVTFVEDGSTPAMVAGSRGVVLVNSTVGLMALDEGKPVYCLGWSIYCVPGLAHTILEMPLGRFWAEASAPDEALYAAFRKMLVRRALVRGNFYTFPAILVSAADSVRRFAQAAEA